MRKAFAISICSLFVFGITAAAQTFEIPGQTDQPGPAKSSSESRTAAAPANAESGGLSWGNSIEVSRLSRAADEAMRRGNAAQAASYAERAVRSAPNDAKLWFMLGYSARLAGRYQTSLDAYRRGLQLDSSAVDGLSGMAQTYMKLGRNEDAKNVLTRLISANPKRASDLAMAGELFVQTGDIARGIQFLERAESIQPQTHTEVLLAVAYLRNKQPDRAKSLLDRAKARSGKNPDVFRAVASYYVQSREYNEAIAALNQIANKPPDVIAELAYVYELQGDKRMAADNWTRAANAAPQTINYQLSAASAFINLGDNEKGRQFLARAQAIEANHYRLHQIRADLAKREKQTQEAIREYNLAIANLPQQGVPEGALYPALLHLNLSEQYKTVGERAKADQHITAAENIISTLDIQGPARAEFLRVRASVRTDANRLQEAEADLKEALREDPNNLITYIQYASLLWKMKRPDDAKAMYATALKREPNNRYALEALGYLAREQGENRTAEGFFRQLQQKYPDDYVAYVALGDLFTSEYRYRDALENYEQAFKHAQTNAQIVAGGANAAIEQHDWKVAGLWLDRAQGSIQGDPRVMKQRERYLFFQGKYLESAKLGFEVLKHMPADRDAVVYLAYDLYNLGRYDDALRVVREKADVLPKEPNLPLLAGHVEKQGQLLTQAVDDYTKAIQLDPNMLEAYVNRGYVLNDLQDPVQASEDFNYVLKHVPDSGTARLGLAFSYLQLREGKQALAQVNAAEKLLGESGSTHEARAAAYRLMRLLADAEREYRAAIKFSPTDIGLHLALADTLYYQRKYRESNASLNDALALAPDDPLIFAQIAHNYAQLSDRGNALKYVELAERQSGSESAILLNTGQALLLLGDSVAAMQRFDRALDAPDANRVDVRLAIARLFAHDGKWDDARLQISLAFAESRVGEAAPLTADNFIEAANLFTAMHEFDLAERYFAKARDAGAADEVVAIGLANAYIARGETSNAEAMLAALGSPKDRADDYDYTLAMANIYRQRHDQLNALTMFARANQLAGSNNDDAERGLHELASEEGMRITPRVSVGGDVAVGPIFDDASIYIMDARLFPAATGQLPPPPRSLIESRWTSDVRVHQNGLPPITGFFQLRNSRGEYSLPSEAVVIDRDTYDYILSGALNPVLRLGRNVISFSTGLAGTFRRDHRDPVNMNQNLFRQFVYMSTNSLGNWLQISGSAFHESGPFTLRDLHSRELGARLDFRVGRPWGNNALLTGYSIRDLLFRPSVREFFQTSTYVGWEHSFGNRRRVVLRGIGEYIRGWRVQDINWVDAQVMRPGAEVVWQPNNRWTVDFSAAYSRGQGIHLYDNVESGFFISYLKPLRRSMSDGRGSVPIEYPLRFSIGIQQQHFMNFPGRGQTQIRPVVRLTLF